jgi:hypothetical protein
MVKWVSAMAALLALACPAVATARIANVDVVSDHAATRAYHRYLSATVFPSRSADDAFVSSISRSCPSVLAAVNLLPVSSVNRSAVIAFGEELGSDLALVAEAPWRGQFVKLARALGRLRWSSRQSGQTVTRYLASVRMFFRLAPSDLCSDARALAASNAQATPAGTLTWLAAFGRNGTSSRNATSAFLNLLARYQLPTDGSLIIANNRLSNRSNSALKVLVTTEARKLGSGLGLSL